MWQIRDGWWTLRVLFGILLNPKKLWYLPDFIQHFQSLGDHEFGLQRERDDGVTCDSCVERPHFHQHLGEEIKEMMGPFWRERDV